MGSVNLHTTLQLAADTIHSGGVIAYPTESCFGLGCDPGNTDALRRILRIKRRSAAKGLIVIAENMRQLTPLVATWEVKYFEQVTKSWPGPFTWLLPASARVSPLLRGEFDTLALRVTAHRPAAKLCRAARISIVSTSANRAGKPMLRSAEAVAREFGDELDFILSGRIGDSTRPSTIRDAQTGGLIRG